MTPLNGCPPSKKSLDTLPTKCWLNWLKKVVSRLSSIFIYFRFHAPKQTATNLPNKAYPAPAPPFATTPFSGCSSPVQEFFLIHQPVLRPLESCRNRQGTSAQLCSLEKTRNWNHWNLQKNCFGKGFDWFGQGHYEGPSRWNILELQQRLVDKNKMFMMVCQRLWSQKSEVLNPLLPMIWKFEDRWNGFQLLGQNEGRNQSDWIDEVKCWSFSEVKCRILKRVSDADEPRTKSLLPAGSVWILH